MLYITQVAQGIRPKLNVYGDDYPTPDGTGVRDYIHVVDLAKGHVAALEYSQKHSGCEVFNLGTGHGYCVLDLVNTFERVNGVKIPYEIVERRAGDIAICYADTQKAEKCVRMESREGNRRYVQRFLEVATVTNAGGIEKNESSVKIDI